MWNIGYGWEYLSLPLSHVLNTPRNQLSSECVLEIILFIVHQLYIRYLDYVLANILNI